MSAPREPDADAAPPAAGDRPRDAPAPGVYEHYKGASYRVIDLVRHSETERWLVLYRPLYGEGGLWVRPVEMFVETVITDAGPQPRFLRTGD